MEKTNFVKDFNLFRIKISDLKDYSTPEEFSKNFKQCSAPVEKKDIKITNELNYLKQMEGKI
ncbi:hypothetical protein [Candidatus Ruminimicrobium bovinum]|uniref:hypothetical protein n=1 Tax=Candidatus Ruminimicrobium bovinum TaxID=3242779 RepID=UPI0039B988C5